MSAAKSTATILAVIVLSVFSSHSAHAQGWFRWSTPTNNQNCVPCPDPCQPAYSPCPIVDPSNSTSYTCNSSTIVMSETGSGTITSEQPIPTNDLLQIRRKLEQIQPNNDPTMDDLQKQLKNIEDLLRKNSAKLDGATKERLDLLVKSIDKEILSLRLWKSKTGERSAYASLCSVSNGNAYLRRPFGKTYAIPIEKLSEEDVDWISKMHSAENMKSVLINVNSQPTSHP